MSRTLSEYEQSEAMRLIQDLTLAGCQAWEDWDGVTFFQGPDMSMMLSDTPHPLFNAVLVTKLIPAQVSDSIGGALRLSRNRNVPLSWHIYPGDTPPSLEEKLLRMGFKEAAPSLGMLLDLDHLDAAMDSRRATGVDVVEVVDAVGFGRVVEVLAPIMGFSGLAQQAFQAAHGVSGFGREAAWRHLLAKADNEPGGAVSLFQKGEAALLANLAVAPQHMDRNMASALALEALLEARKAGTRIAVASVAPGAAQLFTDLGFLEAGQIKRYIMPLEEWQDEEWREAQLSGCLGCSGCPSC